MTGTDERLLDAGLRLFAEHGFRATTVGQIEEAAGFVPRGGTMYKHFASKRALLEAAIARHVRSLDDFDDVFALFPLADLRSELLVLGRRVLQQLDQQRLVAQVLEKDGAAVPDLVERMRVDITERGYELALRYLDVRFPRIAPYAESEDGDREATAVLVIGGLVNLRRTEWTFGKPPLGIDDDRAVNAWADVVLQLLVKPRGA